MSDATLDFLADDQDAKRLKARVKQLERLVQQQAEHMEQLKKAKFKLPKSQPATLKGCYERFLIPDTHGFRCDKPAIAAMLADLEAISPREIVLLGDHLECGGFLAQHWTLGYVAEVDYTFEQDVTATNVLLDEIQKRCPKSHIHYLEGNHEARIERFCVSQSLKQGTDAQFLLDRLSPEVVLSLQARNIPYYRRAKRYCELPIRGTIRLGKCYFTHGDKSGKNATRSILADFAGNVVHGHTHTAKSDTDRTVRDGLIYAWCPGCLCDIQPMWQHTAPTDWSHGYGLQLVRPDGDFLGINVPIIEGKSYLVQLTQRR